MTRTVAIVAALAVTASAATAVAATDPKSLALRTSDLPANARRTFEQASRSAPLPGGLRGNAYAATFRIARGEKREDVHVIVIAAGSAGKARAVYSAAIRDAKEFVDSVQHSNPHLPSYGDAQYAAVIGDPGAEETGGQMWVRKGSVVWGLDIKTDPLAKDFGFSKAQTLTELRTYARKERARAGNG
jgi:hypothetical protein